MFFNFYSLDHRFMIYSLTELSEMFSKRFNWCSDSFDVIQMTFVDNSISYVIDLPADWKLKSVKELDNLFWDLLTSEVGK